MKKLIILSLFMLALIASMFAQGAEPRTVYQEIALATPPTWTMTDYPTTDPHYLFRATYAGITFGTDSAMPEVSYFNVSYVGDFGCMIAQFDQAAWPVANTWVAGQTVTMNIWYRDNIAVPFDTATNPTAQYIMTVPAGFDPIINIPTLSLGTDVWTIPSSGGGPVTYTLTVTSTPAGKPIYKDNVATGQVTPYTFDPGVAGTYKVVDAAYTWIPVETVVPALTVNTTIDFQGTLIPPADTYTYNLAVSAKYLDGTPIIGTVVNGPGTYVANTPQTMTTGALPTATNNLLGNWTIGVPPAGYEWQVNPINVTAGMFTAAKSAANLKAIQGTRTNGAKTAFVYNAAIEFVAVAVVPPTYTLTVYSTPVGAEIFKDAVSVGVAGPMGLVLDPGLAGTYTAVKDGWTYAPIVVPALTTNTVITFTGTENIIVVPEGGPYPAGVTFDGTSYTINKTGIWTITLPMPAGFTLPWYISINTVPTATIITMDTNPDTFTFDFGGAKAPFIFTPMDDDPTLPVELSSFTATTTAQNFVKLTWVSESETGLLGYRVYRNQSNNQAGAISITPTMVPATNTSTTQTYSIVDNEVNIGSMYWYWLESVDMGHTTFHDPVSVLVEGEVPPVLPEYTTMRNAYPNPFKANTNTTIEVSVKAGEAGTVSVYNILGQVVKTFSVREGLNPLTWNGRDMKGNVCGSGIYFYKLSTPSMNQTKKMVIVK